MLDRLLPRARALLLGFGALYMLAIQRLSPHPLPGLVWLGLFLLAAALTDLFSVSRFRKITRSLGVLAILLGAASLVDIARPHAHPSPSRTAQR